MRVMVSILTALGLFCLIPVAFALDADEAWLEFENEGREVNEGALEFLPLAPGAAVHRHENRIRITAASLASGWVELEQCHSRLDAVGRAQIVFGPGRVRALQVKEVRHIGRAWVEGATVQLEEVQQGARLCLAAQTRALTALGEGRYRLRNGPYMRRFLDGYYPMRVHLEVVLEGSGLRLERISPPAQPGFALRRTMTGIDIEASFSGRLETEIILVRP